jgi:hypothetical protein
MMQVEAQAQKAEGEVNFAALLRSGDWLTRFCSMKEIPKEQPQALLKARIGYYE